ncbi:chloramphenicol acetyltransferase [Glutamicibacter uratoxydans]|uniref:Chloramphenicol acetyltransferase n=1 Tax=Glutamicibacter uratoxydans TaxID=43667 RepID=A0A4Y4DQI2_GLUUR|nr:CatA-like O-acetyltransferase [Glutamicibacter uratoxydans]GED05638.1 chloramphenicol acetyltransferase [Glutamicibacter uratoxydans]
MSSPTSPEAQPIDLAAWPRAEQFQHFLQASPCTYSMTLDIDVTDLVYALHDSRFKTYPTQIWLLATAVNRLPEARLTLDSEGKPAIWPVVHPVFTVFNPETESFCAVPAHYNGDFAEFHDHVAQLLQEHKSSTQFFPLGEPPANSFDISSIPWASFTGFNLNIAKDQGHLAPIITLGKYAERAGRVYLPVALQVHHAAMDGFHSARLLEYFAELCSDLTWFNAHG